MPEAQHSDIKMALNMIRHRRIGYQYYGNYYNGHHRLAFASDKFLNAFGRLFCDFSDNLCSVVVDAVADRLELTGFDIEKGAAAATTKKLIKEIWELNRMDVRSKEVHKESIKLGDSYVIVWPDQEDPQKVRIYPQKSGQMAIMYDEDEGCHAVWASKIWLYRGHLRLNMYYEDRIEKYITRNPATEIPTRDEVFMRWTDEGEDWPVTHDYGRVPVFHFTNNAPLGCLGVSELHNVVPLQDALNKAVLDMMVAMEFGALPQRYATGLELEVDQKTGKPKIPFQPGIDRIWAVESSEVNFGEFRAADLKPFIDVQSEFRTEIARVSSTPLHYIMLTTNPPSGEALQAMEERFIKKVRDRQGAFGNTWEDVLAFAVFLRNKTEVQLSAGWKDPAPTSSLQQSQVAINKKTVGVSTKQLLRELSYTEQQVEEIMSEAEEERKKEDERQSVLQERQMRAAGLNEGAESARGTSRPRGGKNNNGARDRSTES